MKKFKAQLNAYWYRVKWNMYMYENELVVGALFSFILIATYVIISQNGH